MEIERQWDLMNDLETRVRHLVPGVRVIHDGTRGLSIRFAHRSSVATIYATMHDGAFEITSNASRGIRRTRDVGQATQYVETALNSRGVLGLSGLPCCPGRTQRRR